MPTATAIAIPTTTHGRVLVRQGSRASLVLMGFHGYFENAEIQMARLESIQGSGAWTQVSVQGLHRFYRGRTDDVVASWMTRQDRALMIADNIAYVDRVVAQLVPTGATLITCGFSQGVAMAFRSAIRGTRRADGIIAVGGDIPPELREDASIRFPATLLLRGLTDEWYTAAKLETDVAALTARGAEPSAHTYDGAHEWNDAVDQLAGKFCAAVLRQRAAS